MAKGGAMPRTDQPVSPDVAEAGAPDAADDVYVPTAWEWQDKPPSTAEVVEKLKTLDDWYGEIRPEKWIEFVQPLGQSKNVSLDKGRKDYKQVYGLYVTVAGRLAALNQAAYKNDWVVEFIPEQNTPTGIPGFLEFGDRIVYREYLKISGIADDGNIVLYGMKPGMAWVPGTGGSGAVASNRFEKVETSARGRAIGAWGIGILPGSGVASYDEVQAALEYARQAGQASNGGRPQRAAQSTPTKPEEAKELLLQTLVQYEQTTGVSQETVYEKVRSFAQTRFGKEVPRLPGGAPDVTLLKPGEIILLNNAIRQVMAKYQAEQPI